MTIASKIKEQRKDWSALWCWTGHLARPWNTYAYFRRVVDLPGSPQRVVVRVSADALYTLYVNEHRVHQGPARSFPGRKAYDTLDLTGLFHAGKNVISVIAHQFGVPTFFSVFRDASGFLFDGVAVCEGSSVPLHTPNDWLCRPARGWRKNVARNSIQLAFQEHFDADADPPAWMSESYEATEAEGWKSPWKIGPVGTHPWLLLEPRGVPLLADHVESLAAVVAQFRGENPRGYKVVEDVCHLVNPDDFKKDANALENPAGMLSAGEELTIVNPPPEGEFVAATLDLGTYRRRAPHARNCRRGRGRNCRCAVLRRPRKIAASLHRTHSQHVYERGIAIPALPLPARRAAVGIIPFHRNALFAGDLQKCGKQTAEDQAD